MIFLFVSFLLKHKVEMYGYGFFLSLTGYLGLNLVLTLVRVSGAFAAVTVIPLKLNFSFMGTNFLILYCR